jgi:cyclopropane-fatty-acyl-phospholipid synthase
MSAAARLIDWTEQGLVPDTVIRAGIRKLLRERLQQLPLGDCSQHAEHVEQFVRGMNEAPIAPVPDKANEQHYEVPAEFFAHVLGTHRKYSSCFWRPGVADLEEAERAALALTCERAGIAPGMRILELGCGWGSLTLWMAENFPDCRIVAVSNSSSQRTHIRTQAQRRGLSNLEVHTCDMNAFEIYERFDRVVSVEMFEHMRNYRRLFARVHDWLTPGGRFFMHIFCHRSTPYEFEDRDDSDWMSRYFFSGGIMPSDELPLRFQEDLRLVNRWRWNGRHYEKTANAWLANLDRRRDEVWPILESTYGAQNAQRWFTRWRVFFMACAELFGYGGGEEWWVAHYLFERPAVRRSASAVQP